MSLNPFVETELEEPFQNGFAAGFIPSDADNTPPSPFPLVAQDAYAKGLHPNETHARRASPSDRGAGETRYLSERSGVGEFRRVLQTNTLNEVITAVIRGGRAASSRYQRWSR